MIDFIQFWPRSLVFVTQQRKLEMHKEDSMASKQCPVYVKPIKEAFYLSFTEDVTMEWRGGRDLRLVSPDWWVETYNEMKMRWLDEASDALGEKTFLYRYHTERPLGGLGNCSGHAGGMVANFFTGLSIRTDPGVKCLVTRPFNVFSPILTVQDGIFDTDLFHGEFSVNFQFMLQDRPFTWQRGEPFAALFFYREADTEHSFVAYGSEKWAEQWDKAKEFYLHKGATNCPYHKNPALKP